jgi:hypothetical protein
VVKSDPNPHITKLLQPVFSPGKGMADYFSTFNNPLYAQEILNNNFSHFLEFIQHGQETKQGKVYYKSVIRLYTNKLKSCPYINAGAFADALPHIKTFLHPQFLIDASKAFESPKDVINEILLSMLVEKFPEFKANPGTFLDSVAQDIEDAMELRKLFVMFLETSLMRLIWNPQDREKTWENVKKIADALNGFYKGSMITDQDDLNSLYITLVERYCFFLDITNANVPASFYQGLKSEITANKIPFLQLAEQEQYLETKSQRLLRTVFECEAKARAREQGILV